MLSTPWKGMRDNGMGETLLVYWDYLVSGAVLTGLAGAESPPPGPGRPAAVVAAATAAAAATELPWFRVSEGTLRVLRQEERLQEHR